MNDEARSRSNQSIHSRSYRPPTPIEAPIDRGPHQLPYMLTWQASDAWGARDRFYRPPLERLSDDLLFYALSFLAPRELTRLARTNKALKQVAEQHLYRRLRIRVSDEPYRIYSGTSLRPTALAILSRRENIGQSVLHARVRVKRALMDEKRLIRHLTALFDALSRCPKLISLHILLDEHTHLEDTEPALALAEHLPQLADFEIRVKRSKGEQPWQNEKSWWSELLRGVLAPPDVPLRRLVIGCDVTELMPVGDMPFLESIEILGTSSARTSYGSNNRASGLMHHLFVGYLLHAAPKLCEVVFVASDIGSLWTFLGNLEIRADSLTHLSIRGPPVATSSASSDDAWDRGLAASIGSLQRLYNLLHLTLIDLSLDFWGSLPRSLVSMELRGCQNWLEVFNCPLDLPDLREVSLEGSGPTPEDCYWPWTTCDYYNFDDEAQLLDS